MIFLLVTGIVLTILAFGAMYVIQNTQKNKAGSDKVLSLADLDDPTVEVNSETSDKSVDNIVKELKAKINEQVAAKENPIETVRKLVGILCNTANAQRATQCIDYVKEFLDSKMDTLKLTSYEYGQPDKAQMNYWRAQFCADLAYGYEFIVNNNLMTADSKPIATVDDQLKYSNLYLEIAQNTANWGEPQVSESDGHTWYAHQYEHTDTFLQWREQLRGNGGAS